MRPRRLKLVTYKESCCCSYLSLYFFHFFFLSNFQTLKIFVSNFHHTFLRNCEARRLKLGTQVDSGQMYNVYWNHAAAADLSLYFSFFFLSNFQTLKFFVTLFSRTVSSRRLKLVHPVISSVFSLQFSVTNLPFSSYSFITEL